VTVPNHIVFVRRNGKAVWCGNSWQYKRGIETIEAIGVERDLAGLPVAYAPPELFGDDASPDDKAMLQSLKDMVVNIRRDEQEGVVFPLMYDESGHEMFKLSLLTTGGTRQFSTDEIITRYDQRIAMVVLADFILLGHEAVGSKALSVSKVGVFTRALKAWADMIAATINEVAIPRLLRINNIACDNLPKMEPGEIKDADLGSLGSYLWNLKQAGATLFPNDELTQALLRAADLPDELPDELKAEALKAQADAAAAAMQQPPTPDAADANEPAEPKVDMGNDSGPTNDPSTGPKPASQQGADPTTNGKPPKPQPKMVG